MRAKILKFALLTTTLLLVSSCGSGSPYTQSSGGSVPVGTTSFLVTPASDFTFWVINGGSNPTLTLQRGATYTFTINATGHPFYIMTVQGTDTANEFTNGVSGNGTQTGTLTFTVPSNAPSTLYYDCGIHAAMTGTINITN